MRYGTLRVSLLAQLPRRFNRRNRRSAVHGGLSGIATNEFSGVFACLGCQRRPQTPQRQPHRFRMDA
jgi:hypothetical protein